MGNALDEAVGWSSPDVMMNCTAPRRRWSGKPRGSEHLVDLGLRHVLALYSVVNASYDDGATTTDTMSDSTEQRALSLLECKNSTRYKFRSRLVNAHMVAILKFAPHHSDRLHTGLRSSWQRFRHEPHSTWRQHHWIHAGRAFG
jgi:hypothetical protein